MSKYSPAPTEFAVTDYNPHQISFATAKADGIYMGRLLMKNEILNIIKASSPTATKAVARIIELIEKIEVDTYANDSTR